MLILVRWRLFIALAAGLLAAAAMAGDICSICGKPLEGAYYQTTDKVTGLEVMVCSNCISLPRCFICGLPVKDGDKDLPDGRHLCARDGKTAVLDAGDARQIAANVHEALDHLFARFTSFPTNVDVSVLDRIDADKLFQVDGNDFESPNLLGCIGPNTNAGVKRYAMRLLTGLPLVELKATAAHEFSHAWAGENVPPERHGRLDRDAEEGFCELVAYLMMDAQNETAQKKFILQNHYTRGQIDLFIAAEQRYGFDQVLDWMQYGETSELEAGHLEKIREVKFPATAPGAALTAYPAKAAATAGVPATGTIRLQGILWSQPPTAIINGRTVSTNGRFTLEIGGTDMTLRCLEIKKDSVRIENVDSGKQEELHL